MDIFNQFVTRALGIVYFAARSPSAVRILIADDHEIYRIGLRRVLEGDVGLRVVGEAADGEQTIQLAKRLKPDILLLDLAMPRQPGMKVLRELAAASLPMHTIILTAAIEPPQIVEALQHGARGIVLKDTGAGPELIKSIRAVLAGQYWIGHESVPELVKALVKLAPQAEEAAQKKTFGLTAREIEIVGKIVLGYTNKDIARECSISEDTVKRHLTKIFDKTGVSNRLELALFALGHRLVDND